jgi:hypothetical protein
VSFIISTALPVVLDFEPALLAPPTIPGTFSEEGGRPEWSMGVTGQHCHGDFVSFTRPFSRAAAITIVRAFRRFPTERVLLGIYGEPAGRYGVAVVDGYLLANPAIQADRFEDNDVCTDADLNSVDPERQIDVRGPFIDTLTIDNPFEVDWFRFTVPEPDTTLLSVRTQSRPFAAPDSSNIGLLLLAVTAPFFGPFEQHTVGSSESLVAEVVPGDYYLAVMDDAGVAVRYSLCIGVGSACPLPGSSPQVVRRWVALRR